MNGWNDDDVRLTSIERDGPGPADFEWLTEKLRQAWATIDEYDRETESEVARLEAEVEELEGQIDDLKSELDDLTYE